MYVYVCVDPFVSWQLQHGSACWTGPPSNPPPTPTLILADQME